SQLEPGQVSRPFLIPGGVALIRLIERTPAHPAASNASAVLIYLKSLRGEERMEQVMSVLRQHAQAQFDTTNIRWTAALFQKSGRPRVSEADTGRVLARSSARRVTVGQFISEYLSRPMVLRQDVTTTDLLRRVLDD